MKSQVIKQEGFVFILIVVLIAAFGVQGVSYAQEGNPTITASVQAPLTEATLNSSVVTLTLTDATFERSTSRVRGGVTVSGIHGVTVDTSDVRRVNNTKVTVELTFSGNIDTDTSLVFTVGSSAIVDYNGAALTTQLPVTAVEESLVATTEAPLAEATLHGSVVTLTLSGRSYTRYSSSIEDAITISGINGVAVYDVDRISNTEANVELTFSGNIDTDATLTLTVGANAIVGYNEGFTLQLPVTAVEESLVATTEAPLTEATLSGSVVTLTLSGRSFDSSSYDIERALTISGIDGVTIYDVDRNSNTEATVDIRFSGNIDADATLTLTVGANAIVGYNEGFTFELPVTAVEESLVATTVAPLTEATLSGSVVTLTLNGRSFNTSGTVSVSGIDGVTISRIRRVSNTQMTVSLAFSGNIDADSTLTFIVSAARIAGYNEAFTIQLPITAVEESLVATTAVPLTEATLHGSIVTLTLSGRSFDSSSYDIERALTISGIDGVTIYDVDRNSDTEATVDIRFSGNIDADATLTLTVGANAIVGYNEGFTFELPVTAVEESLVATTAAPLTEATLHGNVVTLTLNGRSFVRYSSDIARVSAISGIESVTGSFRRVSNTEATITLSFSGNIDADATLTITVGANAIVGYNQGFTLQLPVTAVEESLVATTAAPLTEATLNGSVVTLTLSGRNFTSRESDIREARTISGIEGVTVYRTTRVSDTEVILTLSFSGNIDADGILTITVDADAIAGYNKGFTFQLPVTAVEESLVATTVAPLTEATLSGSVVTLTLSGRVFDTSGTVSVSGIEGVEIKRYGVTRVSDTELSVELIFSGNIDADSTLTITANAAIIAGYNKEITVQLPVTAVAESLVATTAAPLTEATLHGNVVTLTLSGRSFDSSSYDIERALTISGIDGVTIYDVDRNSNTEATVDIRFSGNIDVDATLTLTVGANAIIGYNEAFTLQLPVTAVEESLVASTAAPLAEATLSGSVVTLTLNGRSFVRYSSDIARVSAISGIESVTGSFRRVSNTEATITLGFSGNIDADAILTITVGANAIVGYNQGFTLQLPVTAVEETLVATTAAPLTEATLHGSIVTLTLSGRSFDSSSYDIERALTISGIDGVTIYDVDRNSNTEATVDIRFSGNIDADATLTLTVGANAIVGYNEGFTFELPVTAVEESLVATTVAPLTEATLSGSVVTLTLNGRSFNTSGTVSVSGIDGVTISRIRRVSNTQMTVSLAFSGNIDADSTLTFIVSAARIAGYNEAFTIQLPITAVEESLVATTAVPLTEATLHGSLVTLTLSGRQFTDREWDIRDALTISGVEGVTIVSWVDLDRVSATKVTIPLIYAGNIDADATLTLTVGADAIIGYNEAFTVQLPVAAVEESLVATTETPLTEATLSGSVVTLTLSGRSFDSSRYDIERALTISGIEGVTVYRANRVSDTKVTVVLISTEDFDIDSVLTLTVGAGAIAGYNEGFSFEFPVTAVEESLIATTETPLSEATLTGSVVTLTLSGRHFTDEWDIENALSFSGIEGIFVPRDGVDRVSNTEAKVTLLFAGNIDIDGTFTLTVGADAITSYNEGFSFEFPVTAVEESLVASMQTPLTEATLYGNSVILTLNGRNFTWWTKDVQDVVTVSGIEGVTVGNEGFYTENNSQVAVPLFFSGDIDEDATLTLTVAAGAIAGYNEAFTAAFSVPAVEESLEVSSEFSLNEATLPGTVVTFTLNGRQFTRWESDIFEVLTVSGIDGVSIERYDIDRVSDTEIEVDLNYDGTDFDIDGVLTFTVGADAIAGYEESLTANINVTAIKQSEAKVSISPNPIVSPPLSEQLTFSLNITNGKDVAGFQAVVWHDDDTLTYVGSAKGNYLPADAFFVAPTVPEYEYYRYPYVPIAATALDGVSNGNGTLATLTFEVYNDVKESEITLTNVYIVDREGVRWEVEIEGAEVTEPGHDIVGDINRDGIVNIRDLVLAGNRFGLWGENRADINEDGIVDIADLVLVANAFGADAAAPSLNPQGLELLTAADVKDWLTQAQKITLTDPDYRRGISILEQLHKALTPKKTALLPNFPNPFNPETWIPYHLAKDAEVTLRIYAMNGTLVRTLAIGHQTAGIYQSRSRAAYWDGKNEFGESVASGVYFYTLKAGDFTATRKMIIRK